MYGEGQVGSLSAQEYVAEAKRWARAIKLRRPHASSLCSCGKNGWSNWDMCVIDGLAGLVDMHSVHIYTGSEDYWTNVLSPHIAERAIDVASSALRRAAYKQRLPRAPTIAYDEWNVWFRAMSERLEERLQLLRRSGRRHLPERLRTQLPVGEDGEPGANGQRHRTDRYDSDRGHSPAHFLPFPPAFARAPRRGGGRLRRRATVVERAIRALEPVASPGVRPRPVQPRRRHRYGRLTQHSNWRSRW